MKNDNLNTSKYLRSKFFTKLMKSQKRIKKSKSKDKGFYFAFFSVFNQFFMRSKESCWLETEYLSYNTCLKFTFMEYVEYLLQICIFWVISLTSYFSINCPSDLWVDLQILNYTISNLIKAICLFSPKCRFLGNIKYTIFVPTWYPVMLQSFKKSFLTQRGANCPFAFCKFQVYHFSPV